MTIGIITGSGSYSWPGLADARPRTVPTPYGDVDVTEGRTDGHDIAHISRHGAGHHRLSNHVAHKANLAALRSLDVSGIVSLTVCGALDPAIEPGSLIVFDDLHFPSNRLPDGSLCTWFGEPGGEGRGHWIFDRPMSEPMRRALLNGTATAGVPVVETGCYGQVDGPRFNSRSEIAALRAAGVTAVSQTAGPEIVLAGEAELPIAVLGYVTDHANGVPDEMQPVEKLLELMATSTDVFAAAVTAALPSMTDLTPAGFVYRF